MDSMTPFPVAVVFDMDGTLTDSEATWDAVRRALAEAEGVAWPREATVAMMGMSTAEWSSYLADAVGLRGRPDEIAARAIDTIRGYYEEGRIPLLPGAREAVLRMAELAPLGVASSSPPILIVAGLAALGVADLAPVTVSTQDVPRGKPAPDGYLEACRRLAVDPGDAVAVEDSANGIRSALAAGLRVVAVPPHFHPPEEDVLALADAVIDSLDDLTPELVRGLFG